MDTLFLIAGKMVWLLLRPETILLLLFALPLVFLWRDRPKSARRSLAFALTIAIVIGFFPVGNVALNPLERAYPNAPDITAPSGIIVLGGMEDVAPSYAGNVAQVNDASERLIAAVDLARRFPDARVVFTGGKVALHLVEQDTFEVGPDVLRQMGLPGNRLLIEGQSRSTAENAAFSRDIVSEDDTGPWVLVTSAYHMPRALGTFCAAGWRNLIPYPVDYRGGDRMPQIKWDFAEHLRNLNTGVKEWIGLLAYRLTDRTIAFFPDTSCDERQN